MRMGLPDAVRRRFDALERYSLRVVLLLVALVLVMVPFATLVFQVVAKGPLTRFDGRVAGRLNEAVHAHPVAVSTLRTISHLGHPVWLSLLTAAAIVVLLARRRRRLALFVLLTCAGGGLLNSLVKLAVDRPRPEVDHEIATAFGKSFPSGHAMSSTVVYGALLVVFLPVLQRRWRRLVVPAVAGIVLLVGSSRPLLGVHFVSDVIGGYVLGLAWLAGSVALFETWREEEGKRPTDALVEGVEPEGWDGD
jgi:membrane-associated phospholipid phosphatase